MNKPHKGDSRLWVGRHEMNNLLSYGGFAPRATSGLSIVEQNQPHQHEAHRPNPCGES